MRHKTSDQYHGIVRTLNGGCVLEGFYRDGFNIGLSRKIYHQTVTVAVNGET